MEKNGAIYRNRVKNKATDTRSRATTCVHIFSVSVVDCVCVLLVDFVDAEITDLAPEFNLPYAMHKHNTLSA